MLKRSKSEDEWESRGGGEGEKKASCASLSHSPSLVLLWTSALLTQKTLELLCQLFTADRLFGLSSRTLGLLGRTASLTLEVFDMSCNFGIFGNRFRYTCVKLTCLFFHLRQ